MRRILLTEDEHSQLQRLLDNLMAARPDGSPVTWIGTKFAEHQGARWDDGRLPMTPHVKALRSIGHKLHAAERD